MARGRFISKEITLDKKVNSLSCAYSMLAFTWLLTHTDGYGRTYGDPAVVKSMIFPRRPEVTVDDVDGYIREWSDTGLINWYEVAGDMYIEFPNFTKHQVGLRPEKEGRSNIPPNPANAEIPPEVPGNNPDNSGNNPENDGKSPPEVKGMLMECEGECELEVEGNGDCGDLINEFMTITGIEYPRGRKAEIEWDAPLSDLKIRGMTVTDMRTAIQELDGKKYPILSPKSIYNACDLVMKRRKRKGVEGYIPASSTEYSGVVIR